MPRLHVVSHFTFVNIFHHSWQVKQITPLADVKPAAVFGNHVTVSFLESDCCPSCCCPRHREDVVWVGRHVQRVLQLCCFPASSRRYTTAVPVCCASPSCLVPFSNSEWACNEPSKLLNFSTSFAMCQLASVSTVIRFSFTLLSDFACSALKT